MRLPIGISRGGSKRPMVGAATAAAAYVDDDCHDSSSQSHVSLNFTELTDFYPRRVNLKSSAVSRSSRAWPTLFGRLGVIKSSKLLFDPNHNW